MESAATLSMWAIFLLVILSISTLLVTAQGLSSRQGALEDALRTSISHDPVACVPALVALSPPSPKLTTPPSPKLTTPPPVCAHASLPQTHAFTALGNPRENTQLNALTDNGTFFKLNLVKRGDMSSASGTRNFWQSITLTKDYFIVGATADSHRSPGDQALQGIRVFRRDTLCLVGTIPINMRYAPVVADGLIMASGNGAFNPLARVANTYSLATLKLVDTIDLNQLFFNGSTDVGQGVTGPLASQKSSDTTCGTRAYYSSYAYNYFAAYSMMPQKRAVGLSDLTGTNSRGMVNCYCSKTLIPCWDTPYFNGKAGGMPGLITTVGPDHVNTNRSNFVGAVEQRNCSDLTSVNVGLIVPEYFTVLLDKKVLKHDQLKSNTGNVWLEAVSDSVVSGTYFKTKLSYYAAHWNTPAVGMALTVTPTTTSATIVKIISLVSVTTAHVYVSNVTTLDNAPIPASFVSPFPSVQKLKRYITTDAVEVTTSVTSFSSMINLHEKLSDQCAIALGQEVNIWSEAAPTLFGVSLKIKMLVGDTVSVSASASMSSVGSSVWTPAAVDDDTNTLYLSFGNAAYYSFDRFFLLRSVLEKQKSMVTTRTTAISTQSVALWNTVMDSHKSILDSRMKLDGLQSKYDLYFRESSVHALDSSTGDLKWMSSMESVDPWFYDYTSYSTFNVNWGPLASSALGVDVWKDVDTNNIYSSDDDDYVVVSNKGGILAKINKKDGIMVKAFKFAPGTAEGSAGTTNFGGMCVTKSKIAVVFAAMVSEPGHRDDKYAWQVEQKNAETPYRLVEQGMPTLSAYDMKAETHLWTVDVPAGYQKADGESKLAEPFAAGITCIGDQVLSACPHYPHICVYSARTGSIVQVVYNSTVLGTGLPKVSFPTVSAICDGDDCFQWGGGAHVTKYQMVSDINVGGYNPAPSEVIDSEIYYDADAAASLRNDDDSSVGDGGVYLPGPYDNRGVWR